MKKFQKHTKSLNVLGSALSREQLKAATGGKWMACFCYTYPAATWFADYSSISDPIVDINGKCGDAGGSCS